MRAQPTAILLAVLSGGPLLAQVPAGGEFRVNSYTTDNQFNPQGAFDGSGRLGVVWTSRGQDGDISARGQRYADDRAPAGDEFRVDSGAPGAAPVVAAAPGGTFLVAWQGASPTSSLDVFGRRFAASGSPRGAEFRVNTNTTERQYTAAVAPLRGGFVVTWHDAPYSSYLNTVRTQRYDAYGQPAGAENVVHPPVAFSNFPAVAGGGDGGFVVAWEEGTSFYDQVKARVYDAAGLPVTAPFSVTTTATAFQGNPSVARAADGAFVVVWQTYDNYGFDPRIRGRRFTALGTALGDDFVINEPTNGFQRLPSVAIDSRGDFVVVWSGGSGADYDVMARRFDAAGVPRGPDFRVNSYRAGNQYASGVASDAFGNFVVTWSSADQDGSLYGAFGQRFGGLRAVALGVDTTSSPQSDGNGVMEPGEGATFRPSWRNVTGAAQAFTGTLPLFTGPAGATYTITDGVASYGTVANGDTRACTDCYGIAVSAPANRPSQHWDALAHEDIAPEAQGQRAQWRVHVGESFADVPRTSAYYRFVETMLHHGVTAGCTAPLFCPQAATTREQMAVFVLVAREESADRPPACTASVFADVPASSPFCPWIEELVREGVVGGCGGGNYCPQDAVTREQMAVFVLRTLDGALVPRACTTPLFADVPASSPYCRWIEELARRGVVNGCGGGNYCPSELVTREQMAVFISATFGLTLYGPLA